MAALARSLMSTAALCACSLAVAACTPQGADKPASVSTGQGEKTGGAGAGKAENKEPERIRVGIAGKTFRLEPALDDATRTKGLGGRTEIEEDGGMIFVFPTAEERAFVMRDCPVPIDILFINDLGRVFTTYAMVPEEPRRADESAGDYENRLKRYNSRIKTAVVVELKGGKIKELGIRPGDKIDVDIEALKKRAK